MRISWMFCLFVLLFVGRVGAQCPDYTLVLNSQKLVDAFPKGFPNCKELQYALTITGDVTSIDSLIQLEQGKSIFIQFNSELTNLNGLSNFKEIESLSISYNPKLINISQANKIQRISNLIIDNNELLNEITGFDSILEMTNLQISNNPNLQKIEGFFNLKKIINTLHIIQSLHLNDIKGFINIIEVLGTIYLDNLGINQLDFLPNLKKVHTYQISNNQNLNNLDYLGSLKEASQIFISNNFNLISTSALKPKTAHSLSIYQNSNLLFIEFLDSITTLNQLYIHENAKLKEIHAVGFAVDSMEKLSINNNNSLIRIDNFNLSKVIKRLIISKNINLISAPFLKDIHFVDYSIEISENPKLEAIEFINLSKIGKLDLVIVKNTSLTKLIISHLNQSHFQRVEIENNPKLETVLFGPIVAADQVNISKNASLSSLGFLKGIQEIMLDCTINENKSLIDLNSLSGLNSVRDLTISNNEHVTNLWALDNLQTARNVIISNNSYLTSLFGKNNISTLIQGSFVINKNEILKEISINIQLEDFTLLEIQFNSTLETIDIRNLINTNNFNLIVNSNPYLQTLNLSNVKRIISCDISNNSNLSIIKKSNTLYEIVYLTIDNNPKLFDISAFMAITKITNLIINANSSLLELRQLTSLKTIYGFAKITNNENLNTLFDDVTEIDGALTVSNNPNLTDITGLRNIPKLLNYVIINNSSLTHCAINSVCKSFENNTNKFFYSNGVGCRFNNEVKEKCLLQKEILIPNPAHNFINFTSATLEKNASITIYDIYGRQVQMIKTTQPEVDISALNAGTYILQVESENINFKKKFVKY